MQTFTAESIDNMNVEQLRYMLKMQLERNELLVQQNEFSMFRYECASKTMHLLTILPDRTIARMAFPNYLDAPVDVIFAPEEHKRVTEYIKRLIEDPSTPKTGAVAFTYKDGRRISCEYTRVTNEKGEVIAIIGQHVDMYKTHQRLVSAIDSLNEKTQISDKMMNAYDTIISFDLSDMSYKVIRGTQAVRAVCGQVETWVELANLFRNFYIDPSYHKIFNDFTNRDTLQDRIYGQKSISCTYKTSNIGWCHARIVPLKTDSKGNVEKVIFTTESMEANKPGSMAESEKITQDTLTNLLSRTSGEDIVNKALKTNHNGAFMLFDCDFFNAINSMLGYPVGDMVLIEVSKVLQETFPHEIVARIENDEFAVYATSSSILSTIEKEGMQAVFNTVSENIQNIHIPEMNGVTISASCGMVFCKGDATNTFDKLYAVAKNNLQEAQKKGSSEMCSSEI